MNSSEYWKKREEENLRKNQKTEQQIAKEIQNQYAYMADSIEKEINGFYTKYAKKEGITMAEARKRVSQIDIDTYSRKAKKYVKDKEFSAKANEEMRLYNATMKINRLELLKANIGLEMVSGFDEMEKTFGSALTKRAKEEYARQSGILGSTVQDMQKAAKNIANASFKNATYSERVWMYQDQMKSELNKLLQEGLIQGKNPRALASHMRKLFGASKSDAERLLVTEMARVQTDVQKDSFDRNGYEQYEFIAIGSACGVCRGLDGKHFDVKKMLPGENAPPMHPNCRCSVAAYEDSNDYESWLDFLDKGGTTEAWNSLKSSGYHARIKHEDIAIHRSLGAAAKNYKVKLPDGKYVKLMEGTKITKVYTFAGKGTNKEIRVAGHLEAQYGVPKAEWKKVRGDGYVLEDGSSRHVELHWFESDKTGKISMKVKRYFDEG